MQRLRALFGGGSGSGTLPMRRKDTGDEETENELARLVPEQPAAALRSRSRSPGPFGRRKGDGSSSSGRGVVRLKVSWDGRLSLGACLLLI